MWFPALLLLAGIAFAQEPSFDKLAADAAQARDAGRLEEAINLYARAMQLRPDWVEGWWYLGSLNYDLDRYAPARDAFLHMTELKLDAGPAVAFLGLCEFSLKNYDMARVALGRGRELGLGDNEQFRRVVIYHLGVLENRAGQPEIALRTMKPLAREAIGGASELREAFGLAALRRALLPSELPAEQHELFRQAGLAQAYLLMTDWVNAAATLQHLVAAHPDERGVHYLNGTFLLRSERGRAVAEFEKEIALNPGDVPARLQIAFECLKAGDYTRGLPFAQAAVKLDPKSFPARNALGRLLLGLGQVDRAIAELQAGLKLEPTSPDMHFALAQAYTRAGRREDARREQAEFKRLDALRAPERQAALQQ